MSFCNHWRRYVHVLCNEFKEYVAPTYFHDRCERSLHMHLYTMHKRDILLALCGFVCSFILLLLIGLAGPNVARLHSVSASHILSANRVANQTMLTNLMHHGPFVLHSPLVNSYDDHLRLWMTIRLRPVARPGKSTISTTPSSAISAEGDHTETFQKSFPTWLQIIVRQSGDAKSVGQLMLNQWKGPQSSNQSGSYHNLRCFDRQCEPILLVSLEQLDHFAYTIRLGFDQLINAQFAPKIEDIEFTFATLNPTFASLSIWFRLLCLLSTLIISCLFFYSLHTHRFRDWSLEQKWTGLLLICLLLYDNPLYPTVYLFDSKVPRELECLFQHSFFCVLALYWLTFFHGLRQSNRSLRRFYVPKLTLIGALWTIMMTASLWTISRRTADPTIDLNLLFARSYLIQALRFLFIPLLFAFFVYGILLALSAFTELKSLPYFDIRLKLQLFLSAFVIVILTLTSMLNNQPEVDRQLVQPTVLGPSFLRLLPWMYDRTSSASFLSLYALTNLYVFMCAFFYHPSSSSQQNCRVVRDNPTLSMINDSDEDVIYGSDLETEPPVATQPPSSQSHSRQSTPRLLDIQSDSEQSD